MPKRTPTATAHAIPRRRDEPEQPGARARATEADELLQLQRSAGNQSVARLVASRQGLLARRPGTLARAKWDPSETTTKAALSAQLRDGLQLAVANPGARPNPLPAWVVTRAKADIGYDGQMAAKRLEIEAVLGGQYDKFPAHVQTLKGSRADFIVAGMPKGMAAFTRGLDLSLENTINGLAGFQWAKAHENRDGDLPGVQGAGGYTEYYAEPDPGYAGLWGRNRCLRSTGGQWWVTPDHYTTYQQVTDA